LVALSDNISGNAAVPALALERLLIGLGQGFVLWLLYKTSQAHSWPSSTPEIFGPALLVALFVPVGAVMTLGSLRPLALAGWLAVATVFLCALGLHEVAGSSPVFHQASPILDIRPQIILVTALALFIAQALIVAGDSERRPIATYPAYFDVAWKQEVQLLLALLFLGLFWGVLGLGASLFHLIGIDYPKSLISRAVFAMPASAFAFASALHLTDIRVGLVRGMRNVLHLLLSWLLPLATMLIIAFLASLPFTGLAPLWRTSHGSQIVLSAAAVLVILVNTAYRDGTPDALPRVLRWSGSAAALCLPLLVAISAYGLALRIEQRGWTEIRIIAVSCAAIGGCYAIGYAWAAVASRPWLRRLEGTNVATACVIVLVIATLTTIADPARLAVIDQVARLEAGRISPSEFDFKYFRFDAARYGLDALDRLRNATGPNAETIKQLAEQAIALKSRYGSKPPSQTQLSGMPVFPPGQTLPQSFLQQHWNDYSDRSSLPTCLYNAADPCEGFLTTDPNGRQVIVLAAQKSRASAAAFALDAAGTWQLLGSLSGAIRCDNVRRGLRAGEYRWVAPQQMDLEIAGQRLTIRPARWWASPTCQ
jgi:hypothetical protein